MSKTIKKIEGKQAIGFHLESFVLWLTIWLLVGAVIGLVFYYHMGGMGRYPSDSADTVFWVCLLVTPFINLLFSSKRLKKINAVYAELASKAKASLSNPDYYNTGVFGGIAVDVNNSSVAAVSANDKFKVKKKASVFNTNKIKACKAYEPYRIIIDTSSLSAGQSNAAEMKNAAAKTGALKKTGLYFDLDDIHNPQVFVQMPFDEAEKWLLIIEKLTNGSLEAQPIPMLYPQITA